MKLLETIRYEHSRFANLEYHQKRMNDSRKALFDCKDELELYPYLEPKSRKVGLTHASELFKLRIIYTEQIEEIEFIPYRLPKIKSLKLVSDNKIKYNYKFLDRAKIENLYQKKDHSDDILIVRNELITDTSYANILFFNGKTWITPEKPLLKGTQRAKLLLEEKIKTAEIRVEDLTHFEKARLINAMIRFEDELDIDIAKISE